MPNALGYILLGLALSALCAYLRRPVRSPRIEPRISKEDLSVAARVARRALDAMQGRTL